jgi:hypothetical protein
VKKKICSQCNNEYGVNSFDGSDICAKCTSWITRRARLKAGYIERYREVKQYEHKSDVGLQLATLEAVVDCGTIAEASRKLGVNPGNIHKAINGKDVPILRRKLKVVKRRKRRQRVDRMAARLSPEEGQRLRSHLKSLGYESVTDYWLDFLSKI